MVACPIFRPLSSSHLLLFLARLDALCEAMSPNCIDILRCLSEGALRITATLVSSPQASPHPQIKCTALGIYSAVLKSPYS